MVWVWTIGGLRYCCGFAERRWLLVYRLVGLVVVGCCMGFGGCGFGVVVSGLVCTGGVLGSFEVEFAWVCLELVVALL